MNELIVLWTSNNSDIINVSVTLKRNGISEKPSNIEWFKKGASITVPDNTDSYNVSVMEQNKCGHNFSSNEYLYQCAKPDNASCTESGTSGGKTTILDDIRL